MQQLEKLLNEKQVSEMTGIPLSTLRNHRSKGIGFPYVKHVGSVFYLEEDVATTIKSARVQTRSAIMHV